MSGVWNPNAKAHKRYDAKSRGMTKRRRKRTHQHHYGRKRKPFDVDMRRSRA